MLIYGLPLQIYHQPTINLLHNHYKSMIHLLFINLSEIRVHYAFSCSQLRGIPHVSAVHLGRGLRWAISHQPSEPKSLQPWATTGEDGSDFAVHMSYIQHLTWYVSMYVYIYIHIIYIWLYIYDYIFNIRSNHLRTHLRWSVPSWLVDPTWRFLKIGVPPDRKFDEFRKPWSWGSPILTLAFVASIRSVQLPILFWLPLWNRPSSQGTNPHSGSKARLITMFDDKIHHFSWFLGTSFPPFPHRIFFQTNAFFGAVGSARRLLTWDWHGLTPHRLCLAWHPQNV